MGYKYYAPQIKSRHHHKSVTGVDLATARIHLETNVSRQSISRWNEKVRLTGCVVSDPATYKVQGRNPIYDDDDLVVLHDVIQEDPTLYLDEIQDIMHQLVNKKPCIASIAKTIEKKLNFTFKKGGTVDPRQSLEMQGIFSRRIGAMPSQYMVFLDEVGANERDIFRKYIRSEKGTRGERLVHS
ncbi:uncharacterized protein MELLADRAFT_113245 [Melampsora larici-populina 98AG31]|uniref:Uncharacterized protein n=1 Tax=Melampsora larici-populina (strain 98AG31 / pathotype 3-4-7) TaxID=747676 RepID=F4S984_MELLP|nr:uncharacterized protein MELLADRAFT_113245 [Melampsora larici-populina 98AG31]EGF98775.1 hypothetical protein MELLADRAFT_113245 [Melampsora larici-populina 98AG31]